MRRFARLTVVCGVVTWLGAVVAQAGLPEYQTAVLNTPSLISYYTFDNDTGGANSTVADVDPDGNVHNALIPDTSVTLVTGAAALDGLGKSAYCSGGGLSQVQVSTVEEDFIFPDGSGTVELWFNPHFTDTTRNIIGCVDSSGAYRWNVRFRPQDDPDTVGVGGVTTTDPNTNIYITGTNGAAGFSKDSWYHLAIVFKAGGVGVQIYVNGVKVQDDDTYVMKAGFDTTGHLVLGSRAFNGTSTRWIGWFDEVAVYAQPLDAATILNHYVQINRVVMSPANYTFAMPGDPGPVDVTLSLTSVAGAGGVPIALTYDAAIIAVTTAEGTPIPSGGSVTVPAGGTTVGIKVSAGAAGGTSALVAAASGFSSAQGSFTAQFPPIGVNPSSRTFTLPADVGPMEVTIDLSGGVAGAGGLPVVLTYNSEVLAVTTLDGTPIPTGGAVNIPAGGTQVKVKVIAVNGGSSTLKASANGYSPGTSTYTAQFPGLTMSPNAKTFTAPSDVGPLDVTLGLSYGAAGAGGLPVVLTYSDPMAIAVTTWSGATIPSGGTVMIPEGSNNVLFKVSASAMGISTLKAVAAGLGSAQGTFTSLLPAEGRLLAYQTAILNTPSLISYWTFDNDPGGVPSPVADVAPVDPHEATIGSGGGADLVVGAPAVGGRGKALSATGSGWSQAQVTPMVPDYNFLDGTGTVEGWFNLGWNDATDRVFLCCSDQSAAANTRYAIRFRGAPGTTRPNQVRINTGQSVAYADFPADVLPGQWHHLAVVFDEPNEDPAQRLRIFMDGLPLGITYNTTSGLPDHLVLGLKTDAHFIMGSTTYNGGANRYIGKTDEVAVYADPLTADQIQAHYLALAPLGALNLTPNAHAFQLPAAPAPLPITLTLPAGLFAPAGGLRVLLDFNAEILGVTAGGGYLVPGSELTIPAGSNGMQLNVTPLSQGKGVLQATARDWNEGRAILPVQVTTDDGIIIVEDHFDDNPLGYSIYDLTALGMNPQRPGAGWNLVNGKTQRERGAQWQVLADGSGGSEAVLSGKDEDEFPVLTAEGIGVVWVVNQVTVTADNAVPQEQLPGGMLADCRHEFGIVSADQPNTGDNQLYNNTHGGLYVNVFYDLNSSSSVTGNVRAVNATHVPGDLDTGGDGLTTVAWFTLDNVTQVDPQHPLIVSMHADQHGWAVAFGEDIRVTFTSFTDAHVVQGRLVGGWGETTLGDAAMTTEFANGAFLHAMFQNVNTGRGSAAVQYVKACIGCTLPADCANPFSDADHDRDTDLADFARLQSCFSGMSAYTPQCRCFDPNGDGRVDADDVAAFMDCFSGPGVLGNPDCDN